MWFYDLNKTEEENIKALSESNPYSNAGKFAMMLEIGKKSAEHAKSFWENQNDKTKTDTQ